MSMNNQVLLHLSLLEGVGPAVIEKMVACLTKKSSLEDLYAFRATDLQYQFGLSEQTAQKIAYGLSTRFLLDQELALIEKHQISVITIFDEEYPDLLKAIHLPPPVLYCKGTPLPKNNPCLAVIGSRAASGYGKRVIDSFVPELVNFGFTIVSGGALGADSMAHQAALNAGGTTIAILGSGLLRPYPEQNEELFDAIIANNGTLVSPFFLRMNPLPGNFPARNRIIAGLSCATVVVQAAVKSGARITATFALEQGRDVFAVPGPIDDPLSAGCNALIGQGALILTGIDDIKGQFPDMVPSSDLGQKEHNASIPFEIPVSKEPKITKESPCLPAGPAGIILSVCRNSTGFDELLDATGLGLAELNACLFSLQIDGLIRQNAAGMWEKAF